MGVIFSIIEPHLQSVPIYFTSSGCIFIAFGLVYIAKLFHIILSVLLNKKYDTVQAGFRTNDTGAKMVTRAYNAHCNAWE